MILAIRQAYVILAEAEAEATALRIYDAAMAAIRDDPCYCHVLADKREKCPWCAAEADGR